MIHTQHSAAAMHTLRTVLPKNPSNSGLSMELGLWNSGHMRDMHEKLYSCTLGTDGIRNLFKHQGRTHVVSTTLPLPGWHSPLADTLCTYYF